MTKLQDFSLKEGVKIKIPSKGLSTSNRAALKASSATSVGSGTGAAGGGGTEHVFALLKPPPMHSSNISSVTGISAEPVESLNTTSTSAEDDEWGDFNEA